MPNFIKIHVRLEVDFITAPLREDIYSAIKLYDILLQYAAKRDRADTIQRTPTHRFKQVPLNFQSGGRRNAREEYRNCRVVSQPGDIKARIVREWLRLSARGVSLSTARNNSQTAAIPRHRRTCFRLSRPFRRSEMARFNWKEGTASGGGGGGLRVKKTAIYMRNFPRGPSGRTCAALRAHYSCCRCYAFRESASVFSAWSAAIGPAISRWARRNCRLAFPRFSPTTARI